MGRTRLAVVTTVAVLVAACSGGRFRAILPDVPGDYFVDSQPVELLDLTGLVTAFEPIANPSLAPDAWSGLASAVPGDPLKVQVGWGAGMCEDRTRMRLEAVENRYELQVDHDNSVGAMIGCTAAIVFRGVTLHFSEPISPAQIDVRVDND